LRTVPKEINTFSAFILPNCMKVVFFQVLKGLLPQWIAFGMEYQHSSVKF